MDVKQLYGLVNDATSEILGESGLITEDLQNLVDVGDAIFNANAVDRYVRSLVNHIGRVIFVNRNFTNSIPGVYMDSWEFGSVLEKIACDLPDAQENESWELVDGASYDPNIFKAPKVYAKFFNKKITFEIQMSFTELQVKQSFSSAEQLNGFVSMLYQSIENSMTLKIDSLVMRTINNMIAQTANDAYNGASFDSTSTVTAVNLLYLYNQTIPTPITDADALTDPDFIRFASYIMNVYATRMSKMSTLFNQGGKERFTPDDRRITVLHGDFVAAAKSFLYSGTYHDEFVALPQADVVPYWQGSGTGFSFADTGAIDVTTANGDSVNLTGIVGVMFDRDALGVTNLDRRITSNYNPKAEFYNNWYKFDAGYFNDFNENFVVFFIDG